MEPEMCFGMSVAFSKTSPDFTPPYFTVFILYQVKSVYNLRKYQLLCDKVRLYCQHVSQLVVYLLYKCVLFPYVMTLFATKQLVTK